MKINIIRFLSTWLVLSFDCLAISAARCSGFRRQRHIPANGKSGLWSAMQRLSTAAASRRRGRTTLSSKTIRSEQIIGIDPTRKDREGKSRLAAGDLEIDATGKYVLPGLINVLAHTQDERGGTPQPVEYCMKMWLACGITTVRDVLATKKTLGWRDQSAANTLASPRIFAYGVFTANPNPTNAEEARARVRELKMAGYDGIKLYTIDRDLMQAMEDEAHKVGMRIAHHVGVEETNAWDDIKFGTTSIEHWYGIPDAAIESGRQNFPATYNYNNEVDRFRYAGHLWREANWDRLMKVLDGMVEANAAHGIRRSTFTKPHATCSVLRPNPGICRLPASGACRILQTKSGQSRFLLLRMVVDGRGLSGKRFTAYG